MGLCQAACLHGVIGEVSLCIFVSIEADDGDGVLVSANRAVAAEAPDFSGNLARIFDVEVFCRQGSEGNIINDTDSEVVLRCILFEVFVYSCDLTRCGIFRGETITAAYDSDITTAGLYESHLNVQVQRFCYAAGFFRAVHNGNFLNSCRNSVNEMFNRERTIEVNLNHADFFAVCVEVINRITNCFSSGAHDNDQFFCIFRTIVVEQFVVPTSQFVDFIHVVLYYVRDGSNFFVSAFFCLEEDIRVNSRTTSVRMFRVQAVFTESFELFVVNQFSQIVVVEGFDTLHFVRRTETIKYVHEGITATDSS